MIEAAKTTPCPPPPDSEDGGVAESLSALDLYAMGVRPSDVAPGEDVDLVGVGED